MENNFANMMNEVSQKEMISQTNTEENVFYEENDRLRIADANKVLGREANPLEMQFMQRMLSVDEYLWNRSEQGGITTGFDQLDKALDYDISPGLYLIAGAPNTGKSALMLQLGSQISTLNSNVHVSYHAIDDNISEILIRYIANKGNITISQAKNPARYKDDVDAMLKRNNAFKALYENSDKFTIWDGDDMTSIEALEAHLRSLRIFYGDDRQIVLMIDSIFDLETDKTFNSDKQTLEYIVKEIKSWSTTYNAAVFTTAHIRKNGNMRPTMEDLKESNRVAFEANFAMLLHNEVGINEEEANIYWLDAETEMKMPVLENKIGKNKFSSFKGTLYYEFMPEMSRLLESDEEDRARYASMI